MCCLVVLGAVFGPRLAVFAWWLLDMDRWKAAFDSGWVALVGFLFLPWTTLGYVLVAPEGDIVGFDWFVLVLAFVVDLAAHGGGAREGAARA